MNDDVKGRRILEDAALVRSARRQIDAAIADLAVRPLDEAAATKMRQALAGDHVSARRALHRLGLPDDPRADSPQPAVTFAVNEPPAQAHEDPTDQAGTCRQPQGGDVA